LADGVEQWQECWAHSVSAEVQGDTQVIPQDAVGAQTEPVGIGLMTTSFAVDVFRQARAVSADRVAGGG
jgi:hypothetical protein